MNSARWIYKVIRSILFSAILVLLALYALTYIALSIPFVEKKIRNIAQTEISKQLNSKLEIGSLNIYPFNEVVVSDVTLYSPKGEKVATIKKLGTGISLYSLLVSRKLVFTYAELIGLDAHITQAEDDGPWNIDFIIDLIKPKDKNKPPTKFDLELRSIVIRDGEIKLDRFQKPHVLQDIFDPNHFHLQNLKADITCPRIKNDDFLIDLRRLSLNLDDRISIDKLALYAHLTNRSLSVTGLNLKLPGTNISPADINLSFDGYENISTALSLNNIALILVNNKLTPSDFGYFIPQLNSFTEPLTLDIDISGNLKAADINRFEITSPNKSIYLNIRGNGSNFETPSKLAFTLDAFNLNVNHRTISDIMGFFKPLNPQYSELIANAGNIAIHGSGAIDLNRGDGTVDVSVDTEPGYIDISGHLRKVNHIFAIGGDIDIPTLNIGKLTGEQMFGELAMNASCSLEVDGKNINGNVRSDIDRVGINGFTLSDVHLDAEKSANVITLNLESADPNATLAASSKILLESAASEWIGKVDIENLNPSKFGLLKKYDNYIFRGEIDCALQGNDIDNLSGNIYGHNLNFSNGNKNLRLTSVFMQNNITEGFRSFRFSSDWFDISIDGDFTPSRLSSQLMSLAAPSIPSIINTSHSQDIPDLKFNIDIKDNSSPFKFFNSPLIPLSDIKITGGTDRTHRTAHVTMDAPYLLKGTKKIIRNTALKLNIDESDKSTDITLRTLMPAKHGEAWLNLGMTAREDLITTKLGWKGKETDLYKGNIIIDTRIDADPGFKNPAVALEVHPSTILINGADWNVGNAFIGFNNNVLTIDGLSVRHLDQYINIEGTASASSTDSVNISLSDMDLGFLFDTLSINNVTFGGQATGEITGNALFSGSPQAYTKTLKVKDLSYNDAVLGDGDLSASWQNTLKKIGIKADISEKGNRVALVDGGIFLDKDSLSFDFDTNKVNVAFLQPFMKAFSSYVDGKASGKAKLYGTFADVNLEGRLHADTLSLKLDPTNVTYSTSGDVVIDPGIIHIPPLNLYDKYGNSAVFSGDLTHNYFHDASFDFKLTDARRLLCYDTNEKINPVWFGTFFCNGNATIHGTPGLVAIDIDMATAPGTLFTFVLNNTQTANDYSFLTFSDKSLDNSIPIENDSVPLAVREMASGINDNFSPPSIFTINLQVSTTPQALMTLVMDPASGDKIKARGSGPININYNSFTDNLSMYGKYTLDEGIYNFTLQDIFIRDFNISPGSSVSFNGDPMNAMLDISAIYRVNTNLSDLDKSFSTDRELNRTNVPVDACLYVKGDLESPSISFDIQLPTLTSDMERKVKSIISTDDMMNRQILYLLALNRFYTPEYMGISSDGTGELASVASSTLSSQFSRMLGTLTDKVSVSPSFRSDRGDFSDFEMDVALSSRLLDNRLLLNGNFGYRDRKTSQTTFVGDFDIEYLLSKNGNLRLKAYNHFNDQNYYLKSALTTQGLGIVYRKDFNNPFTFLRRKRKGNK